MSRESSSTASPSVVTPSRAVRLLSVVLLLLAPTLPGCLRERLNKGALHPSASFDLMPEDLGAEYGAWSLPVDGAVLRGWRFEAQGVERPLGAVVLCGGNSSNMQLFIPGAVALSQRGFDVVTWDYRGFGLSTGSPDLWSLVPDAVKVIEAVRERWPGRPLGLLGVSLGSLVALGAADELGDGIAAVAVEGVLEPRARMRDQFGTFVGWLGRLIYLPGSMDTTALMRSIRAPVLFVHGGEDTITPLSEAVAVFESAAKRGEPARVWISPASGHAPGVAGQHGEEYAEIVARFFARWLAGRPAPPDIGVTWRAHPADGGRVSVDIELTADPSSTTDPATGDELPVEIVAVGPGGGVDSVRVWHRGAGASEHRLVVGEEPVWAGACVPGTPVVRRGDSWERDDAYQRARALWERIEDDALERIGKGSVIRIAGIRLVLDLGSDLEGEELIERCRELDAEIRAALESAFHPAIAPLYVPLLVATAEQYEAAGAVGAARAAYRLAVTLAPENPDGFVSFGDGSWRLGFSDLELEKALRRLATLAAEPERAGFLTRADGIRERRKRREAEVARWLEEQRAAPARASEAPSRPLEGPRSPACAPRPWRP